MGNERHTELPVVRKKNTKEKKEIHENTKMHSVTDCHSHSKVIVSIKKCCD